MPLSCAAYGCSNHNMKENKPGFFRFPNNNPDRRKRWVIACKRVNKDGSMWNPQGKNVYLCGEHFISKRPSTNPDHPDYIPSVFVYAQQPEGINSSRIRRFESSRKRTRFASPLREQNINTNNVTPLSPPMLNSTMLSPQSSFSTDVDFDIADTDIQSTSTKESKGTQTGFDMSKLKLVTEQLQLEINFLKTQNDLILSQKQITENKLQHIKSKMLSYSSLKDQADKFKFYTGITIERFNVISEHLESFLPTTNRSPLSYKDQLLMTLVKLRLNTPWLSLADQFCSNKTSLNDIFWKWIDLIYIKMSGLIKWPDHDANIRTLPNTFRQYFPRLTGIIDCTEIFIERPKKLEARVTVYSNYKKHSTVKFLVGCTPHGSISFLSKAFGGRISDVELVKRSGLMEKTDHHPGDQILADRGFTLIDEFAATCGVELIIPSFTKGKKQLSAKEVETTRQIASVRIHIERVIGLVKNRYHILSSGPLAIPTIKSMSDEHNEEQVASVDKIVTVCCILVNLGDGIVLVRVCSNKSLELYYLAPK